MTEYEISTMQKFLETNCPGQYLMNEPLSLHAWYKIGGPADFFVCPADSASFRLLLAECSQRQVPVFIIGEGSNLLVSDKGVRGVIVSLAHTYNRIEVIGSTISVGAGARLRDLVYAAEVAGLAGLAYLSGIPGTVGGALTMNAGTDFAEIGDVVTRVFGTTFAGESNVFAKETIGFGYRTSGALKGHCLLGCEVELVPTSREELAGIRDTLLKTRATKQPLEYPSCGSVFKRPPGFYVGRLVEESGLKGFSHGDAMVSEKHGGFIINRGSATAEDVRYCMNHVADVVFKRYSIVLEPEVRLIGF